MFSLSERRLLTVNASNKDPPCFRGPRTVSNFAELEEVDFNAGLLGSDITKEEAGWEMHSIVRTMIRNAVAPCQQIRVRDILAEIFEHSNCFFASGFGLH